MLPTSTVSPLVRVRVTSLAPAARVAGTITENSVAVGFFTSTVAAEAKVIEATFWRLRPLTVRVPARAAGTGSKPTASGLRVETSTSTVAPEAVLSTRLPDRAPAGTTRVISVADCVSGATASSTLGKSTSVISSMLRPLSLMTSPAQMSAAGSATTSSGTATPIVATATSTPDAGIMRMVPSETLAGRTNVSSVPSSLTVNSTSSPLGITMRVARLRSVPVTVTVLPGLTSVRSRTFSTAGRTTVNSSSE